MLLAYNSNLTNHLLKRKTIQKQKCHGFRKNYIAYGCDLSLGSRANRDFKVILVYVMSNFLVLSD